MIAVIIDVPFPDLIGRFIVVTVAFIVMHRLLGLRRTIIHDGRRRALYFMTVITLTIILAFGILFNLGFSQTVINWIARVAIVLILIWLDRIRTIVRIIDNAEKKVLNGG